MVGNYSGSRWMERLNYAKESLLWKFGFPEAAALPGLPTKGKARSHIKMGFLKLKAQLNS
ncbi:hypothetical protein PK28_05615 [Hymenobacter sp. DG25B]|nr:hypothetical protein PK28_05615 [Hymenobacter sp. DG25B]